MVSRTRKSTHPAKQYIDDVLAGRVVVGRWVRLAVERHVRDLKTAHERGLEFSEEHGQRIIDFFGFLRHSKGEWGGDTFSLEPWQQFALWVLFGWRRKDDGCRRFRVAYLELARKNGKSTLASGVGLYCLVADGEPGAEIYTAATKRDQARIVHGEAVRMVKASPHLKGYIQRFRDNLSIEPTNSKFEPLGADVDGMDGLNVHAAIVDELHAHKTRFVFDLLDTATSARRQPLLFCITTAGFNQTSTSVCWEQHEWATKVLDPNSPIEDDTFFAFVAAIDEEDDWTDESCWAKANPNLGVSVKIDDLRRKVEKAKVQTSAQANIIRLHLNRWTNSEERWIDLARWRANPPRRPLESLEGESCFAGLDVAKNEDIAALVLAFEDHDEEGRAFYDLYPWFWIPESKARERELKHRIHYTTWADAGAIEIIEGDIIDQRIIQQRIVELANRFHVQSVRFDPWNATQLALELREENAVDMIDFGQTVKNFNEPSKEFERLVNTGRIRHGDNPVFTWMAGNVCIKHDPSGNIRPVKPMPNDPHKVDGIVAAIMALAGWVVSEPEPTGPSIMVW